MTHALWIPTADIFAFQTSFRNDVSAHFNSDDTTIMSYLSVSSTSLVSQLWPETLSHSILRHAGPNGVQANKILPSTLETIFECVDIVENPEVKNPYRKKSIIYKPLVAPNLKSLWSFTARVHGFLEHTQIDPLGNWNGAPETAHAAIQRVVLAGGTCKEAWLAQQTSLNILCQYIGRTINLPLATSFGGAKLRMQRRIFRKKSASDTLPATTSTIDPNNWLQSVQDRWCLRSLLPVFELQENGSAGVRVPYVVLQSGDFVEVEAGFDIVIDNKTSRGRVIHIYLSLEKITRLAVAKETSTSTTGARSNDSKRRQQADHSHSVSKIRRYDEDDEAQTHVPSADDAGTVNSTMPLAVEKAL